MLPGSNAIDVFTPFKDQGRFNISQQEFRRIGRAWLRINGLSIRCNRILGRAERVRQWPEKGVNYG
jgi:hypothetical protein